MSSGSSSKSIYVQGYLRHRYFRLLLLFLALFGLTQFLSVRLVGVDSDFLPKVEYARSFKDTFGDWGVQSLTFPDEKYKTIGEWCTEEQYLDGEWVVREEAVTLDNIRRVFKYTDLGDLKCQAKDAGYGNEPKGNDPAMYARILETAQYEYKPKSGCRTHEWNRWNFAKFCLRSRGGCSIVGDSLADQIYVALRSSMISAHDSLFRLQALPDSSFSIYVDLKHPDATKLAAAAGVSVTRLERPVFVYYRDHHLVNRPELDEAFKDIPGYEPLAGGPPHSEQKFVADRSLWYEKWTGYLRTPFAWGQIEAGGKRPAEEKSTIALSTGPHWSTRELWPRGAVEEAGSDDLILRGYQGAVKVSKTYKVLAWWRGNSPGDVDCWQYDKPQNDRTNSLSALDPKRSSFNWPQYPIMNEWVASRLSYAPSDSNWYLRPTRHALRYLDFWKSSIQRPDSHLKPRIGEAAM
ncbi:hypothetical protein QFC21_005027 [Naganishia friedmannii]|uniref:Uncharacterized protein n=1 Tax=Naganishia friedmannii TaxID=89922 RepID=A0ACC2VBT4_9TREE|nr:hypothetical protein QFC21_005027 [Naganishia friedmannii]